MALQLPSYTDPVLIAVLDRCWIAVLDQKVRSVDRCVESEVLDQKVWVATSGQRQS